jgi:hypothetical protein
MFKKMLVRGTVLVVGTIVSQMVIERLEKRSLKPKTGSVVVDFKKKEGDEPIHKTVEETLDELDKIQKDYREGNLASE